MVKTTGTIITALGLLACVAATSSCSSGSDIKQRRRQANTQQVEDLSFGDASATGDDEFLADAGDADAPEAAGGGSNEEFAEPAETSPPPRRASSGDPVFDDLREELTRREEEAKFYADYGDSLFTKNRFAEAEDSYRRALDINPSLDDVRKRYNEALIFQGKRQGEAEGFINELVQRGKAQRDQRLMTIRRHLEEGQKAYDQGDFAGAERSAQLAQDLALATGDTPQDLADDASNTLERYRRAKSKQDHDFSAQARARARDEAGKAIREQDERDGKQVQALLRKAGNFLRVKDYEKAVEACERVLEIDQDNRVAKFWLADATEQLLNSRRMKLIADRITNQRLLDESYLQASIPHDEFFVFPDDEYWHRVRQRTGETTLARLEEPEPVRRIKNLLETQRVGLFLENESFDIAVEQLKQLVGINIVVDPAVDAESIEVSMQVQQLPAINVLNLLLERAGLSYTFRSNVLYITDKEGVGGQVEFVIYPVSDLLNRIRDFSGPELILRGPNDQASGESTIGFTPESTEDASTLDPDALVELIKGATDTDAWDEPNSMEAHNGQLLVDAPPELHDKVRSVLENLRQDSDLFVVIETRFIDITDDFLEDVGIDSRALGLVNNFGTPFGNQINNDRTGGQDLGFVKQGSPVRDVTLVMGQDRWAGRVQHIIDGFTGTVRGDRLSGGNGSSGFTMQATWLEPFQINTIVRAVQERSDVRQLTAPVITAHNGQRVYVSVITQRAYIADYELVSGGTGFAIIEVADPVVQTFQEGVILDVDPVVHHDKKYVTLDVRPTLATLIGGIISTIQISLGSFTNVAFQVPIGVPEISLQQAFTSVTVPNGGTVLLGGFKSMNESKFRAYLPILGRIPLIKNLFRRKAEVVEKRSLVILLSARIVDLRGEERKKFNAD
jgi:type II secretory pathway component GspD/PulD (secretin)/Tfp pilus assembly protein PilF